MKEYLLDLFSNTSAKLEYLNNKDVIFSVPNIASHGDLSTNIAMTLTKDLKRNPREIANEIVSNLDYDKSIISQIEIAGPGFINFHFTKEFVTGIIKDILSENENFGRSNKYQNKKAIVEFVSANPTGPLTVGHGRNAVLGDTVARMLEWVGYEVDREFYFNNAGRQMRVLGESVKQRYLELLGEKIEFSEDLYQGEYIKDIAQKIINEFGESLKSESAEGQFKETAEKEIFKDIEKTLERLKIKFDNFYNEYDLYESGEIEKLIKTYKDKNLSYEKDGAVWLKFTELGNDQDKVIVKSTGEPTYRLPDIAYHKNKLERNYDLVVDVFGSDHIATYPDVLAGLRALDFDTEKIKVVIYQFVTLLKNNEVVKMSTRKANFVTLDELMDEVGSDVVRYFFNMRSAGTHLNFDIDIAKKQSDENPVFYLQYAHARISSIIRMIKEEKLNLSLENLYLLLSDEEQTLLKKLYEFKDEVIYSAENFESHRLTAYLEDLAALFHRFYTHCRIIGSEQKLAEARIALIKAVQIVLKNGLSIIGVTAPDKM